MFCEICFLLFKKKLSMKCLTQYLPLNRPLMNVVSLHLPLPLTSQSSIWLMMLVSLNSLSEKYLTYICFSGDKKP